MALIDELYTPEQCSIIKSLYSDDADARHQLMISFGSKIIESDKILTSPAVDIIALVCTTATFARSTTEPHQVAVMVHKHIIDEDPLPMLSRDHGLLFSEKALVALSFFGPAMSHRHQRRGAPSPDFYRQASKLMFRRHDLDDIADNHERWESFLSEVFIS